MAHQIRLPRREIQSHSRARRAWRVVRRSHVRAALEALVALYRKA